MVGTYIVLARKVLAGADARAVTDIVFQGLPAIADRKMRVSEAFRDKRSDRELGGDQADYD